MRKGDSPNSTYVTVGPMTLLFSYDTPVAFCKEGHWRASENVWSKTTGKHLNETRVARHNRLPHDEFTRRLEEALSGLG
jgi:hypothetical protein